MFNFKFNCLYVLVILLDRINNFFSPVYQWELRCRARLAHFLLSGGSYFPVALTTYDRKGHIDTITFARDEDTLTFISRKLKARTPLPRLQ